MRTYLLDILPKIQQYSQKLDDLTLLTNQHWVLMDSIGVDKTIYIFRINNELLVSTNGNVTKGKWEYLGNNSILIDLIDKSYLFKQGFFDKNILALKTDNRYEYAVFVNENRFDGELNSIEKLEEFLENRYLQNNSTQKVLEEVEKATSYKEMETKVEGKSSIGKFMRLVGFAMLIISLIVIIYYVGSNQDTIKYHIFNDKSMCFCGPEITQADPIGDVFIISMIGIVGIIGIVKNK